MGWLHTRGWRRACGLSVLCIVGALWVSVPAAAQQGERRWLDMSDDMYPQPDDPGTQAAADIASYLEQLSGQLPAAEVAAFRPAMIEEMRDFQRHCPRSPTYLIDHPARVSDWGDVLLGGTTLASRSVLYWVQTCEASFPMTVFLIRAQSGKILSARGHPGFTLSNVALQYDSEKLMRLTVAQMLPDSCKEEATVFFTEVLAYASSPYQASQLDILEGWSVIACDEIYDMDVELTHSPQGGIDFTFRPVVK